MSLQQLQQQRPLAPPALPQLTRVRAHQGEQRMAQQGPEWVSAERVTPEWVSPAQSLVRAESRVLSEEGGGAASGEGQGAVLPRMESNLYSLPSM